METLYFMHILCSVLLHSATQHTMPEETLKLGWQESVHAVAKSDLAGAKTLGPQTTTYISVAGETSALFKSNHLAPGKEGNKPTLDSQTTLDNTGGQEAAVPAMLQPIRIWESPRPSPCFLPSANDGSN